MELRRYNSQLNKHYRYFYKHQLLYVRGKPRNWTLSKDHQDWLGHLWSRLQGTRQDHQRDCSSEEDQVGAWRWGYSLNCRQRDQSAKRTAASKYHLPEGCHFGREQIEPHFWICRLRPQEALVEWPSTLKKCEIRDLSVTFSSWLLPQQQDHPSRSEAPEYLNW